MSFDIDFDFTDTINTYQILVDAVQLTIDNIPHDIVSDAIGYNQMKVDRAAILSRITNKYLGQKNTYQTRIDYINSLVSLDNTNKTMLYIFWGYCGRNKDNYMKIMSFQYSNMIIDTDLIALANDFVNSTDIKNELGNIIITRYDHN